MNKPHYFKLLLLLFLVFSVSKAYAQFAGGSGTQADPWQIASAEHLNNVRNYLGASHTNKHFIQTADINLGVEPWNTGEGWVPIGTSANAFTGVYDGGNQSISGLYINRPSTGYNGIFGYTSGARIGNLHIVNSNVTGYGNSGALAGVCDLSSIVDHCTTSGSVTGTTNYMGSSSDTGGLIGCNTNSSIVSNCSSSGSVQSPGCNSTGGLIGSNLNSAQVVACSSSSNVSGHCNIGGLVGNNSATISKSFSTGTVTTSGSYNGGLVGSNGGGIDNCYSTGDISALTYVGGLVGSNGSCVMNCFSTGMVSGGLSGGLIGRGNNSIVINSYWNTQSSGQSTSSGGEGRTTDEMAYPYASNTYLFWDFQRIWSADTDNTQNDGYPYISFQIELTTPQAIAPTTGNGTEDSPYQIASLENLYWIFQDASRWDKHYLQTTDIDASQTINWGAQGWTPIGNATTKFTGSYDGCGHSISGLYINRPNTDNVGLFGYTNGAKTRNLHLEDATVNGRGQTGALVGWSNLSSVIDNCSMTGSVTGTGSNTGGLVGYNGNSSVIANCFSGGVVYGTSDNMGGLVGYNYNAVQIVSCRSSSAVYGSSYVGGLVGYNHVAAITASFSTGSVTGSNVCIGGLVGCNQGAEINNSYSRSSVNGLSHFGGLVGYNREGACIGNSYSTGNVVGSGNYIGGLIGYNNSTVSNSYWNTQSSGQSTSSGGEGRTTDEMVWPYAQNSYRFWDFERIWSADTGHSVNEGYPYISFQIALTTPQAIAPTTGSGTEGSPYQIASLGNLYWISQDSSRWNMHYLQTADIDASGTMSWGVLGWTPIGNETVKFSGSYNGGEHTISGLYINRPNTDNVGMFGFTNEARISGLNLLDASVTGKNQTGALVGWNNLSSIIDNCGAQGRVTGTGSNTGGLVGYNGNSSVLANCFSSGVVYGTSDHTGGVVGYNYNAAQIVSCGSSSAVYGSSYVGGLVGYDYVATITASFSTGSVTGSDVYIGGLAGYNRSAEINNSYSRSSVNGSSHFGGLVGCNVEGACISNCYSTGQVNGTGSNVGGLNGFIANNAIISNSYWNTQSSGQSTSSGGEGRTTDEMVWPYPPQSYVNWNWTDWIPDFNGEVNDGYPYLYFQHVNYLALPGTAQSPAPADSTETISGNTILSWQGHANSDYSNLFTGFKLWLGTDNPPTNIVNGIDLGRAFSYDPNPDLATNTTYYWKIVPYNPVGDAPDCPIWSFTTYDPAPQLVYPNGGELWMANTTRQIRWEPNAPPSVKLYISFDNGAIWNSIGTTEGASGLYHYQVPAQSSTNCLIKLTNAADESFFDVSEASFGISTSTTLPKLMLGYPSVSGLHLGVGLTANLSWTRQNVSLVALDYSSDNGLSWTLIAENINADSFSWIIPDYPSGAARIRVRSMQNPDVSDISDNSFRVNKISVSYPNGGELLTGDHTGSSKYLIRWSSPFVDNVKIEYSASGGTAWTTITSSTPANPANYLWTIPSAPAASCLIRISNAANPAIKDVSDATFRIQNPIRIMNANGGGFATNTSLFNIRWHNQAIEPDRMLYWEYSANNSSWTRINAIPVPVTDNYMNWYVDTGLQNTMWLRAVEMGSNYIIAKSESSFRITDKQLSIQNPVTSDILGVDSYANITWHAVGCTTLSIDYTFDFGQSWIPVATGIPSSQFNYLWQVPNTPSNYCRIRLRDGTHSYMQVESEGEFNIFPFNFSAAFSANPTIGFADLTVQFTDESEGFVTSWAWDFNDDGITDSEEENPVWVFRQSGFHSVSLTISDGTVSHTVTRTNYIYVYPLQTDFSANHSSGFLPLTVQFSNNCPSTVLYSQWDFDSDGIIDSSDENPIWTYIFPGTYTVSQWVSSGYDSDTEIKQNYITVSLNPLTTRYVPTQYQTIQAAINAANNGDYIIIANGTYYENLVIEGKSITLASYYFIDGDSTHIANTIIDGSNALNPDQASTITILPSTGRTPSKPHIVGFTVKNGSGRRIVENEGGSIVEKRVGGGIYIRQAEPVFSYNKIEDNDADDEGGGSYAFQSLPNLGGMVNASIGFHNPGHNYFANNSADLGADVYFSGILVRDEIKVMNCSFEVMSAADTTVSNYWVSSSANLDFQGSTGRHPAITGDIYVATNGSNTQNSGLTPNSPFKTIDYALSRIYATEDNPLTIHIASGTYSPTLTGERYPLQMVKHVSLQGAGKEETFLDAEANADFPKRVINLDKVEGVSLSDLTLMNGFVTMIKNYNGGGIGIINSRANLKNLLIDGNSSAGNGGGIYALSSEVWADSISIVNNAALGSGGGIHSVQSDLQLLCSSIHNNSANRNGAGLSVDGGSIEIEACRVSTNHATGNQSKGGGIILSNTSNAFLKGNMLTANNADLGAGLYLQSNENLSLDRNRITNNLADFNGGGMFINTTNGLFSNNLIANNTAGQRGGALYCYSSPEIINSTIADNKANLQGGGLYLNSGSPIHLNSIYWGNVQDSGNQANQVFLFSEAADPQFRYCLIEGGSSGFVLSPGISYTGLYEHNLSSDPLFSDHNQGAGYFYIPGEASFTLQEGSPAINAGDPSTDASLFALDLSGSPRIDSGRIDLGAYEKQHIVGALITVNPARIDFGRINISGEPAILNLRIGNAGNQELLVHTITLESSTGAFGFERGLRTQAIEPGGSLDIPISFAPTETGLHESNLLIHSNALNNADLVVTLTGYGIGAGTSIPGNVELQISGRDIQLSWDPVLSDTQGNLFDPDGYLVLGCESPAQNLDTYHLLGFVEDTQFVHRRAALYYNKLFYRIIAIDDDVRIALQNRGIFSQDTNKWTWGKIKEIMQ